jgi:hypothetical protein
MPWNKMLIGALLVQAVVAATGASHATALRGGQVSQVAVMR